MKVGERIVEFTRAVPNTCCRFGCKITALGEEEVLSITDEGHFSVIN